MQFDYIKWGAIALVVGIIGAGAWYVLSAPSKPLPGQYFESQGRDHVTEDKWSVFKYNSNPPTSGPHDAVPSSAGVYTKELGDGHLVHSLEHGYVVISYNCEKIKVSKNSFVSQVFAHEGEEESSSSAETSSKSPEGDAWNSVQCKDLTKNLSDLVNEQRLWKLIVVPRSNLDVPVALTAWTRLQKLNSFEKEKIVSFIESFRDQGPEKTMD